MPANSYHFVEQWSIPGAAPEAVWEVIADARWPPQWWGMAATRETSG